MGKKVPLVKAPIEVLEQKLQDPNGTTRKAALDACYKRQDIPVDVIRRWTQTTGLVFPAMAACYGRTDVPVDILDFGLLYDSHCDVRFNARRAVEGRKDIPGAYIKKWIQRNYRDTRYAAMLAVTGKTVGDSLSDNNSPVLRNCPDIPWDAVRTGLLDVYPEIKEEAHKAAMLCHDIPLDTIIEWSNDTNAVLREVAVEVCWFRDPDVPQPPVSFFERLSKDPDQNVRQAVINACVTRTDVPLEILERGLRDLIEQVRDEAKEACTKRLIPKDTIARWAKDENVAVRIGAMKALTNSQCIIDDAFWEIVAIGLHDSDPVVQSHAACICRGKYRDIPVETLVKWADDVNEFKRSMVTDVCQKRMLFIPVEVLENWVGHSDPNIRMAAMYACARADTPWHLIERGFTDTQDKVRDAAARTCCYDNDIPLEVLKRWAENSNALFRQCAISACLNHKPATPWEVVEHGLSDQSLDVQDEAIAVCFALRSEVPMNVIEAWVANPDPRLRVQAFTLCRTFLDVPWNIIEKGLDDPNEEVREAARQTCLE